MHTLSSHQDVLTLEHPCNFSFNQAGSLQHYGDFAETVYHIRTFPYWRFHNPAARKSYLHIHRFVNCTYILEKSLYCSKINQENYVCHLSHIHWHSSGSKLSENGFQKIGTGRKPIWFRPEIFCQRPFITLGPLTTFKLVTAGVAERRWSLLGLLTHTSDTSSV